MLMENNLGVVVKFIMIQIYYVHLEVVMMDLDQSVNVISIQKVHLIQAVMKNMSFHKELKNEQQKQDLILLDKIEILR